MDLGDAISELETFAWNLIFDRTQPNLVDLLTSM